MHRNSRIINKRLPPVTLVKQITHPEIGEKEEIIVSVMSLFQYYSQNYCIFSHQVELLAALTYHRTPAFFAAAGGAAVEFAGHSVQTEAPPVE
jgi:phosphomevalonate kinase